MYSPPKVARHGGERHYRSDDPAGGWPSSVGHNSDKHRIYLNYKSFVQIWIKQLAPGFCEQITLGSNESKLKSAKLL